jgi:hypothetical protein
MSSAPGWKPITTTLGPGSTKPIVRRMLYFQVPLFAATLGAVAYYHDWNWLSIDGTLMTAAGIMYSARRLLRRGAVHVEDELPPPTFPLEPGARAVLLNIDHLNERAARAVDNYFAAMGLILGLLGAFVAGALPFMLERIFPLK